MTPTSAFTILVVDESPAVHLFVELAVGSVGVRVIGVRDGYEARGCLKDVRPNLVLTDAGMTELGVPVAPVRPLHVPRLRALVLQGDAPIDPVDTWMGTADAGLGAVPGWWSHARADADFVRDVRALRDGHVPEPLRVRASQYFD